MKAVNPSMRMAEGEDFSAWQIKARRRLEELMGLPLEKAEDNFRIEWTDDSAPNQTEIRFLFESEPEVTVVCHLLLPKKVPQENLPLVICVQGHTSGFHISMGRAKYEGDDPDGGDRDFARQIIARGQAALAIEQRAFGERGGTEKGPHCHHGQFRRRHHHHLRCGSGYPHRGGHAVLRAVRLSGFDRRQAPLPVQLHFGHRKGI